MALFGVSGTITFAKDGSSFTVRSNHEDTPDIRFNIEEV